MTKQFKIIVEKHPDGYVAYPLGVKRDCRLMPKITVDAPNAKVVKAFEKLGFRLVR